MTVDYYLCPKCGHEVKVGNSHCPNCPPPKKRRKKSSPKSWEQDESLDGLDLPDNDFDYDEFITREFKQGAPHKQIGIAWYWWATGIALITGFLIFVFIQITNLAF